MVMIQKHAVSFIYKLKCHPWIYFGERGINSLVQMSTSGAERSLFKLGVLLAASLFILTHLVKKPLRA